MGNECSTHYDAEECGIYPDFDYSAQSCGCAANRHVETYCRQNPYDKDGPWCCDCQCEPGYQCTWEEECIESGGTSYIYTKYHGWKCCADSLCQVYIEITPEECRESGGFWDNRIATCYPNGRRLEIEPRKYDNERTLKKSKKSKKHRSKTSKESKNEKQAAKKKNLFQSVKAATTLMCMHAVAPPRTKYVLQAKIVTSIAGTMSFDIRCGEYADATMHGQTEFFSEGISSPKKHTLAFDRGGEFELSQHMSCPNDERLSVVVTESTVETVGLALDWPTCEGGIVEDVAVSANADNLIEYLGPEQNLFQWTNRGSPAEGSSFMGQCYITECVEV